MTATASRYFTDAEIASVVGPMLGALRQIRAGTAPPPHPAVLHAVSMARRGEPPLCETREQNQTARLVSVVVAMLAGEERWPAAGT